MAPSFQHLAYTGGPVTEIRINRPKSLNSLTPDVYRELAKAFLLADTDPACVVVVFTGEGRFFSSGADVKANSGDPFADIKDPLDRRIAIMLDLKKILVIALNGGAVGVACAWLGYADILLAAKSAYMQAPFSALGLIPESGSALIFPQSMPLRRSNESLIFGAKVSADDMLRSGFANRVFPDSSFRSEVSNYLQEMMETNEPGSMLEAKRLVLDPLRENRHLANFRAHDVGAALFASGLPNKRFKERAEMLARKGKARM